MSSAIVLTASAPVAEADVDLVMAAMGQGLGAPRRLSPLAVEIPYDGPAGGLSAARDVVGARALDVNLVPRPFTPRLLICDMDSTIIPVECIDELADFAGVREQVSAITEQAMRGELDFEGALRARVALLTDLPLSALEQTWRERITLNPGAAEMVAGMKAAGALTALVSGGFDVFVEKVADAAGFERRRANRLEHDGERLTGAPGTPILGQAAKLEALEAYCADHGCAPAQAVAVGDGANDLAMIRAAGLGVAWRAKPAVAAEADARLDHSDLTAVLRLAGLPA